MTHLYNKHILITGIHLPLGQAIALAYAQAGAHVILLDADKTVLTTLDDQIQQATGKPAALYPLSLLTATSDDYQQLHSVLLQEFNHLDGVIHAAFHYPTRTPIEHYSVHDWYALFQVMCHAPYLLTQATLPLLKKSTDAHIIFTDYNFNRATPAYWSAFLSARAALNVFIDVLTAEYQHQPQLNIHRISASEAALPKLRKYFPGREWPAFESQAAVQLYLNSWETVTESIS